MRLALKVALEFKLGFTFEVITLISDIVMSVVTIELSKFIIIERIPHLIKYIARLHLRS